jgi:transcriptional regulator with XRE-family HTH domain
MNNNSAEIADQIKDNRRRMGWSQADLAQKLDTKQSAVSRMESGLDVPKIRVLEKLAGLFCRKLKIQFEADSADPADSVNTDPTDPANPINNPLTRWLEDQVDTTISQFENFIHSCKRPDREPVFITGPITGTLNYLVECEIKPRTPLGIQYLAGLLKLRKLNKLNHLELGAGACHLIWSLGHSPGELDGTVAVRQQIDSGKCPVRSCRHHCKPTPEEAEIHDPGPEQLCPVCEWDLEAMVGEKHELYARGNGAGAGHCVLACDGKYYRV